MTRIPTASNVKIALYLTFFLAIIIYGGIFATEWFFPLKAGHERILSGPLLGIIIAAPGPWIAGILAFYFAKKDEDANNTTGSDEKV